MEAEAAPREGNVDNLLMAMGKIWRIDHLRIPQGRMEVSKSSSLDKALEGYPRKAK